MLSFLDCHFPEDEENHSFSYNYHRCLPNRDSGLWKRNTATINSMPPRREPKESILKTLYFPPSWSSVGVSHWPNPMDRSVGYTHRDQPHILLSYESEVGNLQDQWQFSEPVTHCPSCKICSQFHDILKADSWLTYICWLWVDKYRIKLFHGWFKIKRFLTTLLYVSTNAFSLKINAVKSVAISPHWLTE